MPIAAGTRNGKTTGACTSVGSGVVFFPFGRSANKQTLMVACYNAAPGTATVYSQTSRTAVLIDASGNIDATTTFSGMAAGEHLGGIASPDGVNLYIGGSTSMRYITAGSQAGAVTLLSGANYSTRTVLVGPEGALWAAISTSTACGIHNYFDAPLPTSTQSKTLGTATLVPGTAVLGLYIGAFWFDDTAGGDGALYTAPYNGGPATYSYALQKFVNTVGTWAAVPTGYPRLTSDFTFTHPVSGGAVTPYGVKSISGYRRASDNHLILIFVTYRESGQRRSTPAMAMIVQGDEVYPESIPDLPCTALPLSLLLPSLHPADSPSCTATASSWNYCSTVLAWDATTATAGATYITGGSHFYNYIAVAPAPQVR